jgi:hypothetical protein
MRERAAMSPTASSGVARGPDGEVQHHHSVADGADLGRVDEQAPAAEVDHEAVEELVPSRGDPRFDHATSRPPVQVVDPVAPADGQI